MTLTIPFRSGNTKYTLTLANSIIGASILSMPYCFKQCGIILGCIVLYLNAMMTKLSCHQLIKSALIARRKNYEVLAQNVWGPVGKLWVEICIIGYLAGCCIAYFVVLGDLGPEILAKLSIESSPSSSRLLIITVSAVFIILPLSLLRDVESLNVMSMISVFMYLLLVLKCLYEGAVRTVSDGIPQEIEWWRPSGVLQCIPIFSMALSCQTQMFEVYDSLPEQSLKIMDGIVSSAVNLCTVIYTGVGIGGYLAFYHTTFGGNILVSFESSFVTDLLKAGFLISIMLSFPLCVLPCRTSLYSLLFTKGSGSHDSNVTTSIPPDRFRLLTLLIIVATLVIGVSIPNVEFVLGLVGSTLGTGVCFICPAWLYLRLSPATSSERLQAKVVLAFGIGILLLGTSANILAEEEYADHLQPKSADLLLNDLDDAVVLPVVPLPMSSAEAVVLEKGGSGKRDFEQNDGNRSNPLTLTGTANATDIARPVSKIPPHRNLSHE